jgi:hypothetical protein
MSKHSDKKSGSKGGGKAVKLFVVVALAITGFVYMTDSGRELLAQVRAALGL